MSFPAFASAGEDLSGICNGVNARDNSVMKIEYKVTKNSADVRLNDGNVYGLVLVDWTNMGDFAYANHLKGIALIVNNVRPSGRVVKSFNIEGRGGPRKEYICR